MERATRTDQRPRSVRALLDAIERGLGPALGPPSRSAWELVLRENVGYIADDARREAAFKALLATVGVAPKQILAAKRETLAKVIEGGGILAASRATKLRKCAELALDPEVGPPDAALGRPDARRVLRKYPGIGEPGADKLLLFTRAEAVPTVESNGLRVLGRLGVVEESGRYDADYRAAREALGDALGTERPALERAYFLLRALGQARCKRAEPLCGECPVRAACPSSRSSVTAPAKGPARRPASRAKDRTGRVS